MPEATSTAAYRFIMSPFHVRAQRVLVALVAVLVLASCTGTDDGSESAPAASAGGGGEVPVLAAFDPPLAFDPTAETAMNLGPMVAEGSRLIPRTTTLLDDALVTVVDDGVRRYRATDAAQEWSIERTHEPRPDGRGDSLGVAPEAEEGPRLLAASLEFLGVPPGGTVEAAGTEVVVADVDSGEELWRVEIFPPEAENTSSPLYGRNTLSYFVDVTAEQVVLGYGSATVLVGPDGVGWSAFGPAPSFVDGDVLVARRHSGTDLSRLETDLVGLDVATGALRWEVTGDSAERASSAGAGLAVADAVGPDGVYATQWIDTASGAILGPVGGLPGTSCWQTVGEVAYCLSGMDVAVALDGATRRLLWATPVTVTSPTPDPFLRVASVSSGAVYIDAENADASDLPILDAATGELLGVQDHHVRFVKPWAALCDLAPAELDQPAGFSTLCPAIDPDNPPAQSPASTTPEELEPLGPDELPMPDEARERTVDAARAFARYFYEVVRHSYETGDTEDFDLLSRNCATCERQIAAVLENAAEGMYSTGGDFLTFAVGPFEVFGTRALLEVTASSGPSGYVDANGVPVPGRDSPGYEGLRASMTLTWVEDMQSWIVDGDAGFHVP